MFEFSLPSNKQSIDYINMEKQCLVQDGRSSLLALPVEMIGYILSYLREEDSFFWCYGLVCKSFLGEVTKIMKERSMIIQLFSDESFPKYVELICQYDDIASAVDEVGLDLSNNTPTNTNINPTNNQQTFRTILDRCWRVKVLILSFCDLDETNFDSIANLSFLQRLDLSGCSTLNDENLALLVKSCKKLRQLSLLMCGNISDSGKKKQFFD